MKRILGNGILVLFSICVCLVLMEVYFSSVSTKSLPPGLTMTHPERRYELKPGFEDEIYGVPFRINSSGLRDVERDICRAENCFQILVLGDSITFGPGVPLAETFPKIVEAKLQSVSSCNVQVFNLGVPSYNTVQEVRYLEEIHDAYLPHLVVLEYTAGNDSNPVPTDDAFSSMNRFPVLAALKDFGCDLYTYHALKNAYYGFVQRRKLSEIEGAEEPDLTPAQIRYRHDLLQYAESAPGWKQSRRALEQLYAMSRQRGFDVLVALYINNIDLSADPKEDIFYPIRVKIEGALSEIGIGNRVVLDDAFRAYAGREKELWVTPTDSHFSGLAHSLSGETIFNEIVKTWPNRMKCR